MKNYFEKSQKYQKEDRKKMRLLLIPVQNFLNSIGLSISKCLIISKVDHENTDLKLDIKINEEESLEQKIFRHLLLKDKITLSERNYQILKNTLNLEISLNRINRCKKTVNNIFTIQEIDNGFFYTEEKVLYYTKKHIEMLKLTEGKVKIKISGDGTELTKNHRILLNLSFTFINDHKNCKTSKGNFIIGMFEIEKEEAKEVKDSLTKVLDNLRKLNNYKLVYKNKTYMLDFYIGGDLKFLAIMFGINAANSNRPCIFCECSKFEFSNTEFQIESKLIRITKKRSEKSKLTIFTITMIIIFMTHIGA